MDDLAGIGTERVVHALFARAGLNVTVVGGKYDLGATGAGECDLVVETDRQILLVEVKAKPLTRGAMTGVQGDALLDFAGGMFAAQVQALRHERILRTRGRIDFNDGKPPLVRGGRSISRLSVTLLDHGALQDRMVLWSLYGCLISPKATASPGNGKASQVAKLAKLLDEMRTECTLLAQTGVTINDQRLDTASLSAGSLAVLLDGAANLEAFVARATCRLTTMSFNQLFEFHQQLRSGAVQ